MPSPKSRTDDHMCHWNTRVNRRIALALLVVLLTGVGGYMLAERLYAQVLYEWAWNDLNLRRPAIAVQRLEKAITFEPSDPDLWMRLGDAHHLLATMQPVADGLKNIREAQTAFATAFALNPLDAEAAYRTAAEAALDDAVSADLYEKPSGSPYSARHYFEEALRLRPGSVRYHHVYARYLSTIEDTAALAQVVENTVQLYPHIVKQLLKESLWTAEVHAAAARGLEKAIAGGVHADLAGRMMGVISDTTATDQQVEKK